MPQKIDFQDAYKQCHADQDKTRPPQETVRRFKEKLKTVRLDILKESVRIDTGRLGIPVFMSRCGKDAAAVIGTRKQMGKGATPEQAEASAVMELAERYSFFSFIKNPDHFFIQTASQLSKRAVPFELIARSVHDDSEDLEKIKPFFQNMPLKWTSAWNVTQDKEVLIPFDWFFMINEFNGPSAGNCNEEAVLQGICEVVERHVSSMISRNRLSVPLIDADSVTDPTAVDMIQKYRHAGIRFYVSDFTFDMGIPTIAVLAYDPSTFPGKSEIVWTAGTTPNPQKALNRALTEVAQLAGDFNTHSRYAASGLPKFKAIEEAHFITGATPVIPITRLPDISDFNMKTEIDHCVSALADKHLDVLVVNITHPLLNIPAFYTLIPGAHFRERAVGTSVGLFSAKLIRENNTPLKAVRELTALDAALPGTYYIPFYLGTCFQAMEDPDTALDYFEKALASNPTDQDIPSIYSYMGACLKDMGRYRDALNVLGKGEKYDNERTDIYNLMGFCHFMLKDYESAIDQFKKVLHINPGSAIDYANIASNYRDMGQHEKAIEYYELALALDPSIGFALENLLKLKEKTAGKLHDFPA